MAGCRLCPCEGSLKENEVGPGGWAIKVKGEDVEARSCGAHGGGDAVEVGAGEAAQGTLLVMIDGVLGGEGVAAAAGLDLDEAEGGAVPGDEVDIAAQAGDLPSASDNDVSGAAEMKEGFALAEQAGLKMSGRVRAMESVEAAESPAVRVDPAEAKAGGRMNRGFHGIQG